MTNLSTITNLINTKQYSKALVEVHKLKSTIDNELLSIEINSLINKINTLIKLEELKNI